MPEPFLVIISKSLCHTCTTQEAFGATTDFEIGSYTSNLISQRLPIMCNRCAEAAE